ncbi:MAG: histidine phosphatase family protein [Minisyncoccia bacterium]
MQKIAALMVGGRVVTGGNHGLAFSKLSEAEKDCSCLRSGFLDLASGKFMDEEDADVEARCLLLIRHAEAVNDHLTDYGREVALSVGDWLTRSACRDYAVYSSPRHRCQETSFLMGRSFTVTELLDEVHEDEPGRNVWQRVERVMTNSARNAIFVTHQDILRCITSMLHAEDPGPVTFAAMLHFVADRLTWQSCGSALAEAA